MNIISISGKHAHWFTKLRLRIQCVQHTSELWQTVFASTFYQRAFSSKPSLYILVFFCLFVSIIYWSFLKLRYESESRWVVSSSLQPHGLYSPWNSPGQNTGVDSLSLLQGVFPTQGENPGHAYTDSAIICMKVDLPNGSDSKSICWQWERLGFDPWVGKIPWRRKWQSTPVLLPGKSHGQRSLVGYSPRGCKESDTTERLHFHFHFGFF